MSGARELLGVSWSGLTARRTRTFLIMLGPIVGVAAMVGAVGLTESAKGDLKAKLAELGTNLVIATPGSSFGNNAPTFPEDVIERVEAVPAVDRAATTAEIARVVALPSEGSADHFAAFPVPVKAADLVLPSVLEVPVITGRWLSQADLDNEVRAAVLGAGLAFEYGFLDGEIRTIRLNDKDYGVVGVLGSVALDPALDNAVFVTQWAAEEDFGTDGLANKMYVRAVPGATEDAADSIPIAVSLGGSDEVSVEVPTDILEASAQADETLQQTALFAGLLALAVGGLGIANVMSISVIQRSAEIGIRRAVGHTRARVGSQFLLEALFIGLLGGLVGAVVGVAVVYGISALAGWIVVIDYGRIPIWMSLALAVSIAAGLFPSIKAARLEPLETLRLG